MSGRLDRPRETPAAAATRPLSGPAPSTPASEFPAAGLMPAAAHAADWGERELAARSSCISSARATAASRRPAGSAIAAAAAHRSIQHPPARRVSPGDIEYKAYGPNGRETPWVTDAKLCGTRGRGLPLTGFAVRLAPNLRDRFDVAVRGLVLRQRRRRPQRNGEPCMPAVFEDPLEAIHLRLIERRQQG